MTTTPPERKVSDQDLQDLFNWLEAQPELKYVRRKISSTVCSYNRRGKTPIDRITIPDINLPEPKQGWLARIRDSVWVPGRHMRGKVFSTPELDRELETVAKLMSISTLWDFVTTIPLFQFSLNTALATLALPGAAALSFVLLVASNTVGEQSTNRSTPADASKASISLLAFILLCSIKTLFSGVGVDLMIGSRGIQAGYAKQLAAEKLVKDKQELTRLESGSPEDKLAIQRCSDLERQMQELGKDRERNNTQYISVFVQAYGSNADRTAEGALTSQQLESKYGAISRIPGVCRQRDVRKELNQEKAKPLAAAIENKSQLINQKPALAYLAAHEPEIYAEHFRDVGGRIEWVNGTDAVAQATIQFYSRLFRGELGSLGFSLFSLAVSVILTAAAATQIYLISRKRELKASYCSDLLLYRQRQLDDYDALATSIGDLGSVQVVDDISSVPAGDIVESPTLKRLMGSEAKTTADSAYAKAVYNRELFQLWREHLSLTGDTYYPAFSNDLDNHYRSIEANLLADAGE